MTKLKLYEYPHPILKKKAEKVAAVDDDLRRLLDDMLETMYADNGCGLAAPQIGVSQRIVVIDIAGEGEEPAPMYLVNPELYVSPLVQLLSGGLLLGAIFMATDYVTSPMSHRGMLIYGVCIGALTVVIRLFGAYPEGMSFAILIMNAFTPLINTYVKPKRFGEVAKKK